MLKFTDNSQTVNHDFPCTLDGRQTSGALLSFTTSDWGCYRVLLRNVLPELLQNVNLQSGIYLWYIYVGTPLHLLVPREFLNNVSLGKTESSRWTIGVTCSFRWITFLIFLSPGKIWNLLFVLNKSVTSRACSNECKMGLRWFVGLLEFSSESAITIQTCNVLPWSLRWTPWAFPLILKRP
jgi:hypothetical protein